MGVDFQLLNRKPTILRFDVLPFCLMYAGLLYWYSLIEEEPQIEENILMKQIKKQTFENEFVELEEQSESLESIYARLIFVGIAFFHSLTYLSSFWSTKIRAIIKFSSTNTTNEQTLAGYQFCRCTFQKNQIKYSDIVAVQKEGEFYFVRFMENIYVFRNGQFIRSKPDLKFDLGQMNQQKVVMPSKNILLIPMKHFKEVLKEQLMEPFSFFQIFSVSLWLLDESRFYAMFTLAMLFVTSLTVVLERMKTMLTLRQMKLNPQYITVHRNNQWIKISSEELLPGDICILHTAEQAKPIVAKQTTGLSEDEQLLRDQIPFGRLIPPKMLMTQSMSVDSHKSVPCDLLLLNGSVVVNEAMLTGESVPQVKDSIEKVHHSEQLDIKNKHKSSVIFCGTEIIQVQGNNNYHRFVKTQDNNPHCLALVLRTGFDTAKGKLIKTVFYNNENANVKQLDGLVIVVFLLCFALFASAYVLQNGLQNETRDKNKLFLRCILIVTTVVPPELPMILSIAVNQSLALLQLRKIFCTEPFRIPWAGKVEILAFDKTGTLTNDVLNFTGIVDSCKTMKLKSKSECSIECQQILAGCHQLIYSDQKLQGDPIEILFLEKNPQWSYQAQQKQATHKESQTQIYQKVIFPFKSDLKRMSSLVEVNREIRILTKGAPESLEVLFDQVPEYYREAYSHYANLGYRVLCLADRTITAEEFNLQGSQNEVIAELIQMDRSEFEKNLKFRGFLICESPLKKDTALWMQKFKSSYFTIKIITGDNMLTAIAVAKQLKLVDKDEAYILEQKDKSYELIHTQNNEVIKIQDPLTDLQEYKNCLLCLPSTTLAQLTDEKYKHLNKLLTIFTVFARMSPKQKEAIIVGMKTQKGVLMCGDGTNDVGGLKKADVGIALVTSQGEEQKEDEEEEEKIAQLGFLEQIQLKKKEQQEMWKKLAEAKGDKEKIKNLTNQQLQQATSSLFDTSQPSYKFGDACIAAPFTSKMSTSIRCVHTILKQGVCTLVTTICTYKIMALQSILSAYSLSALHMQSLKLSETQMTLMGILGAGYYFCYSSAKPQRYLSSVKPSFSIFEFNFVFSLFAQAALHLYAMDYAINNIALKYRGIEDAEINNDLEFKPTFQNTVVFLLELLQQSCIFMFNHPGEPHMQKLDPKSKFFKSLFIPMALCIVASFNYSEILNEYFDLKFPDNLQASYELSQLCIIVTLVNYLIERTVKYIKYGKFYGFI